MHKGALHFYSAPLDGNQILSGGGAFCKSFFVPPRTPPTVRRAPPPGDKKGTA